MTRLEKEGLIKTASKGKRLGKLINKEVVETAMKKYFDRNNNTITDTTDDTMLQDPVSVTLSIHACNMLCPGNSGGDNTTHITY